MPRSSGSPSLTFCSNWRHNFSANAAIISLAKRMAKRGTFGCEFCGRVNFTSQNALGLHQRTGLCAIARKRRQAGATPPRPPFPLANDDEDSGLPFDEDHGQNPPLPPQPPQKISVEFRQHQDIQEGEVASIAAQMGGHFDNAEDSSSSNSSDHLDKYEQMALQIGLCAINSDADEKSSSSDAESSSSSSESRETSGEDSLPDTTIRDQFQAYCARANQFRALTEDQAVTIKLLHLLKDKNAPMNAFELIS